MKILAISGSLRQGSHNTDLLRGAAAGAPDGVDIELYHGLKEIPPYDADDDLPGDQPLAVQRFKDALDEADAILISTPEYNSSIPGVLKNALDWASRPLARVAGPEQAGRRALVEHRHVRRRLGGGGDSQGDRRSRRPHDRGHRRGAEGRRAARRTASTPSSCAELRAVVDALAAAVESREAARSPPSVEEALDGAGGFVERVPEHRVPRRDPGDLEQVAERVLVRAEQLVVREVRRLAEHEERRNAHLLERRRLSRHLAVGGDDRALAVEVAPAAVVVLEQVDAQLLLDELPRRGREDALLVAAVDSLRERDVRAVASCVLRRRKPDVRAGSGSPGRAGRAARRARGAAAAAS